MKIIEGLTGSASKVDVRIQSSVSHLLFVCVGAAAITDEVISLDLVTDGGVNVPVIPKMKIIRPATISQYGAGYQLVEKLADGKVKSAYVVALTNGGAIQLHNSDYLRCDLTGLDPNATYEVYGFEHPVEVRQYRSYNTQSITGADSQNKTYSPSGSAVGVAISNNGALSTLRLLYANGKQVSFTPEELNAQMRSGNDISFGPDKLVEGDNINQSINGGGANYWWIALVGVTRYDIITNGGTDVSLIQVELKSF